jgi:hypothetical protein
MCTVTYIPIGGSDFILTSSRDIPFDRESALPPEKYLEDDVAMHYPKDGKAKGTWIGTSSNKRLICLLNGAYDYHTSRISYKQSRGLIVKSLLKVKNLKKGLNDIDLNGVEQFTLTIIDWVNELNLIEFVWDGKVKHISKFTNDPHIWSSSTLYDEGVKLLRKKWFSNWLETYRHKDRHILKFHHTAGIGDPNIDILMNRNGGGTVSITSVRKNKDKISITYEDILKGDGSIKNISYKE